MGRFDEDEAVRSQGVSNRFMVMLMFISAFFIIGLVWGYSIGFEQQQAFGEAIQQITLSDTLGISDKITVNVISGT